MAREVGVEVAWVAGDFLADPGGELDGGVGGGEFDFGEGEAFVFSVEDVYFEHECAVGDEVSGFVDFAGGAEVVEDVEGVVVGDGVFVFCAGEALGCAFDGEPGVGAGDADADGAVWVGAEVGLADGADGGGVCAPGVVADEKFAFDFLVHAFGLGDGVNFGILARL